MFVFDGEVMHFLVTLSDFVCLAVYLDEIIISVFYISATGGYIDGFVRTC